ncbi:T9SS type A sorting domain-containing protein [Paradesertivirga mongoliensis]|uniref:T9SS type A sorting domain-containing protein n=1 Tax=Paradesertivirga mongoliensis TaxID=2100740 RepID=UPI00210EA4A2|nr:T9SS type A sorting domain-containing protein [Pedobacter mongoliensis]
MNFSLSLFFLGLSFTAFSVSKVNTTNPSVLKKTLRLAVADHSNAQCEAVIEFRQGHSAAYRAADGDAPFAGGTTVSISSLTSDNKSMAINLMPQLAEVDEVKLAVNSRVSQNVVLKIKELPFVENYKFILTDKYLNQTKTLVEGASYEFVVDKSNPNTYGPNRFSIKIAPAIDILPDKEPVFELDQPVLSIYPNPATAELHISSNLPLQNVEIAIYNYSGVLTKKIIMTDKASGLDIRDLTPQYYVLVIKEGEKRLLVSKFLKE